MRLAKYLAHSGVASRRRSEELIAAGRVKVAGEVVTDPARDVDEDSGVEVDGRPVAPEAREVWMLNKPRGVVSTAREPGRRRAVVELVNSPLRLYPVGPPGRRIDRADPAHERRRARRAPDASALRGAAHVPGAGAPARGGRAAAEPAAGSRARGRPDRAGKGAQGLDPRVRDHACTRGETARCAGWSRPWATRSSISARVSFGSLTLESLAEGKARRLRPAEIERLWKDAGDG